MTPVTVTSPAERTRAVVRALAIGLVLALLLAWTLLSVALSLPFMLGAFFFMLFGLIIGAAMYRVGVSARPLKPIPVTSAAALVTLVCVAVAIVKEARDFPRDLVNKAIDRMYFSEAEDYEPMQQALHDYGVSFLREKFPPGGVLGYVRYAAGRERITIDLPGQPKRVRVILPAQAWLWQTRVAASVLLCFLGINSQTKLLCKPWPARRQPQAVEVPPGDQAKLGPG